MDFKEKSIDEMGSWLRKDLGFGDKIVDIFKGIALHALHSSSLVIDSLLNICGFCFQRMMLMVRHSYC